MRLTLGTRFSIAIIGVIAVAAASSVLTLLSMWAVGNLMQGVLINNIPSVRTAIELEIAILRQGTILSTHILDPGNPDHLRELHRWKAEFDKWLGLAKSTADTPEEAAVLRDLVHVYHDYDAKRNEVLSLCDRDEATKATAILVHDLADIHERAFSLSRDYIAVNERFLDAAIDAGARRIRSATWLAAAFVSVTIAIGMGLLWLFLLGVVLPLRSIAAEARAAAGSTTSEAVGTQEDELQAVGVYLRALMSNVSSGRAVVEQTRRRLISAEKLASVGKLAASVAHELRNPLTAIKMWLFSIQKTIGPDGELDRKFGTISEEIARMENVIRNFLEFSRPPAMKLQPHDPSVLLDSTMNLIGHHIEGRNIRIIRQDTRALPRVRADADQLKQVFINLLDNAAEVMAEGGEIHLSAAVEGDADGRTMVVVRIRDTGPGMPEDVRQRVFEPFYTTKEEGTGLGLCIAARIMARHGGRLVLESSTSQGTVFSVRMPTAEVEANE